MRTLLVLSKRQIVSPAELRAQRAVPATDTAALAGIVKARPRGVPRRLEEFDVASLAASRPAKARR